MKIAEDAALGSQVIQIRRLEAFGAKNPDVRVALIIGQNNDNIRGPHGLRRREAKSQTCQNDSGNTRRDSHEFFAINRARSKAISIACS